MPSSSSARQQPAWRQSGVASARPEKVSNAVARLVAKEVAERHLPPGSPLPPEQEMAEKYGVGRTSVREALRILESQGLIIIRPGLGGGPIVGEATPADFGKTMSLFLQIEGTRFADVLDVLSPLEGLSAGMAAQRCAIEGGQLFDEIVPESTLQKPNTLMDDVEWMEISGGFHRALWNLAGNDVIKLLAGAVGFIFADRARFDPHQQWTLRERKKVHAEHVEIARAIKLGDVAGARQLTEAHYDSIQRNVRKNYPRLADEIIDWH